MEITNKKNRMFLLLLPKNNKTNLIITLVITLYVFKDLFCLAEFSVL